MANTDILDADFRTGQIKIHTPADFEGMRVAGKLAAECLDMLTPHVVPGVVTDHLDTLAREFILDHGAIPACLGYRGYTKTVCISANHIVCHGIPGERTLREGDIANIDVTVIVDGWHGDTSRMYGVGPVAPRAKRLIDVTYEAIARGLAAVKPGARTGDIGFAIQTYVESMRCCSPTAGRRSPATSRCPPSANTPSASPRPATRSSPSRPAASTSRR